MDNFLLIRQAATLHSTSYASFAASLRQVVAKYQDFFPETAEISLRVLVFLLSHCGIYFVQLIFSLITVTIKFAYLKIVLLDRDRNLIRHFSASLSSK